MFRAKLLSVKKSNCSKIVIALTCVRHIGLLVLPWCANMAAAKELTKVQFCYQYHHSYFVNSLDFAFRLFCF